MEGVSSDVCDPYIGDCICGEHVIGEFCDQCEDGRYNVSEGCPLCQCHPLGKYVCLVYHRMSGFFRKVYTNCVSQLHELQTTKVKD